MFCAALAFLCPAALADECGVTIEGGPDTAAQNYEWVVTNQSQSAVTQLEFPHYRASLFFPPEGWQSECTNLTTIGLVNEPGVCRATAARPGTGIAPGDSKTFRMQCAARSSVPGRNTVAVQFADGARTEISGVLVPQKEPVSDRYLPAVGLAIIAAFFLLFRAMARRKTISEDPSE